MLISPWIRAVGTCVSRGGETADADGAAEAMEGATGDPEPVVVEPSPLCGLVEIVPLPALIGLTRWVTVPRFP